MMSMLRDYPTFKRLYRMQDKIDTMKGASSEEICDVVDAMFELPQPPRKSAGPRVRPDAEAVADPPHSHHASDDEGDSFDSFWGSLKNETSEVSSNGEGVQDAIPDPGEPSINDATPEKTADVPLLGVFASARVQRVAESFSVPLRSMNDLANALLECLPHDM